MRINLLKYFKKRDEPFDAKLEGQSIKGELDENSSTWRFIDDWANNQLDAIRKKNDVVHLDEKQTSVLRGEIRAIKRLLRLPDDKDRGDSGSKTD